MRKEKERKKLVLIDNKIKQQNYLVLEKRISGIHGEGDSQHVSEAPNESAPGNWNNRC